MKIKKMDAPLADRMRPERIEEIMGQEHLLGEGKMLRRAIDADTAPSMVLWGPPGSGKTTLARVIANATRAAFAELTAVESAVKEIRSALANARTRLSESRQKTILFIDEIHRFNKGQQDALLPAVEDGTITLIGATTENPSFSLQSALLSRCRVFALNQLAPAHIQLILERALKDASRGLGALRVGISDDSLGFLSIMSDGDARTALNALELAAQTRADGAGAVSHEDVKEALQRTHFLYDKAGEEHYNIISALHKSMRGSDANASLYWLCRMLASGEDPLYVARRLIRFASEDIGIANSLALAQAVAAYQACSYIGMPECAVNLAQAVVYMAKSKKSNALYTAYQRVHEDVQHLPNEPVPLHLRNAPTDLMKNLGYGKGYKYTPNYADGDAARQDYLPEKLKSKTYIE